MTSSHADCNYVNIVFSLMHQNVSILADGVGISNLIVWDFAFGRHAVK